MNSEGKTIGILGGMGPGAAVYMFELIVNMTAAATDQEHIPVIIVSNPKVPARPASILSEGPSCLPLLIDGAKKLENAGADLIIMPCNTAHYYYDDAIKHIKIPFLHIQKETCGYIRQNFPCLRRFGLLSTRVTFRSGLFQQFFQPEGLEVIAPDDEGQAFFVEAIYSGEGLKLGFKEKPRQKLLQAAIRMKEEGVQAIIAGCSEVSMVLEPMELGLPVIDPMKILAEVAIKEVGYRVRKKREES